MNKQFNTSDDPRHMSHEAFLALGGPNLAYIKPVVYEGESGYGIHAADGTVLAIVSDRDTAFAAARQHDLEPVNVH